MWPEPDPLSGTFPIPDPIMKNPTCWESIKNIQIQTQIWHLKKREQYEPLFALLLKETIMTLTWERSFSQSIETWSTLPPHQLLLHVGDRDDQRNDWLKIILAIFKVIWWRLWWWLWWSWSRWWLEMHILRCHFSLMERKQGKAATFATLETWGDHNRDNDYDR